MKESMYKRHEDLPLFLNSELVAKVLGVSVTGCWYPRSTSFNGSRNTRREVTANEFVFIST